MTASIEAEINRAASLGTQLEHLVLQQVQRGQTDRESARIDDLLMSRAAKDSALVVDCQ